MSASRSNLESAHLLHKVALVKFIEKTVYYSDSSTVKTYAVYYLISLICCDLRVHIRVAEQCISLHFLWLWFDLKGTGL